MPYRLHGTYTRVKMEDCNVRGARNLSDVDKKLPTIFTRLLEAPAHA